MFYLIKTPWWIKKWVYPDYVWTKEATEKKLYLTFDDGPHPQATPLVLDALQKYNARATFFCIGKNVVDYPDIYKRILWEGHTTGNHTHSHLDGWKTRDQFYFEDISLATKYIDSRLFRPPYGHITRFQAEQAAAKMNFRIVMWSVLSGDFDDALTAEQCWSNVKRSAENGSIIVFHDSEKAMKKMLFALNEVLLHYSQQGFTFEKLTAK